MLLSGNEMKTLGQLLGFLLLCFVSSSCMGVYVCTEGSGALSKQTREIPKFNRISVNIASNIFLSQDSVTSVVVETDDNLFDYILTDVQDKELIIDAEKGLCPKRLNFYISTPEIEKIEINGAGDIYAQTPIVVNKMQILIAGAGDVVIDSINANKVKIEVSGSGDIRLGGYCESFYSEINGSGDIRAIKLVADKAKIETNGSGDVYIQCRNSLEVQVSGSGDVYYLGEPSFMKVSISGAGEVKKYNPR